MKECEHNWIPQVGDKPDFRVNRQMSAVPIASVKCDKGCGARTWLTENQYLKRTGDSSE